MSLPPFSGLTRSFQNFQEEFIHWATQWANYSDPLGKHTVDIADLVPLLKAIGFVDECTALHSASEDEFENALHLTILCKSSGEKFIMMRPASENQCKCEKLKDNTFWESTNMTQAIYMPSGGNIEIKTPIQLNRLIQPVMNCLINMINGKCDYVLKKDLAEALQESLPGSLTVRDENGGVPDVTDGKPIEFPSPPKRTEGSSTEAAAPSEPTDECTGSGDVGPAIVTNGKNDEYGDIDFVMYDGNDVPDIRNVNVFYNNAMSLLEGGLEIFSKQIKGFNINLNQLSKALQKLKDNYKGAYEVFSEKEQDLTSISEHVVRFHASVESFLVKIYSKPIKRELNRVLRSAQEPSTSGLNDGAGPSTATSAITPEGGIKLLEYEVEQSIQQGESSVANTKKSGSGENSQGNFQPTPQQGSSARTVKAETALICPTPCQKSGLKKTPEKKKRKH